jgi:hypothetical protein
MAHERWRNKLTVSEDTIRWFFESTEYRTWKSPNPGPDDKFLWFSGKPGSGKSVIISHLLSDQLSSGVIATSEDLAFFFYELPAEQTREHLPSAAVLCILIAQILGSERDRINCLELVDRVILAKAFKATKHIYPFIYPSLGSSLDHSQLVNLRDPDERRKAQSAVQSVSKESLWSILKNLIAAKPGRDVRIVIDAINRAPPDERSNFLESLRRLQQSIVSEARCSFRVLVCSHAFPDINKTLKRTLPELLRIDLEEEKNGKSV